MVASSPTGTVSGQVYPDSLIRPNRRGFQPRIGISWRPFLASSMVVRAGYGVYYNTSVYTTIAKKMAQQSPLSKSLSVENSADHPFTMANGFNARLKVRPIHLPLIPTSGSGMCRRGRCRFTRLAWGACHDRDLSRIQGHAWGTQFLPNTYPSGLPTPVSPARQGMLYGIEWQFHRESGQLQLRRRLHNGFTANLQYTFAKSIDDAALGGRGQGNPHRAELA